MEEPQYHLDQVVHAKAEHLEDFDGPLDVILLLLSKNKIEIQDISITSILEEFIAMASHLMLIKTKMLLSAAEQEEAQSEMELLIRSLEERQRQDAMNQIRGSVTFLSQRNEIGLGLFPKEPEPLRRDQTYRYSHDPADLVRIMAVLADRSQRSLPPPTSNFSGIVGREPYPVTKKAAEVLRRLLAHGVSAFRKLFRGNRSRSEIVATFLAILELCRLRSVTLEEDQGEETCVKFVKMPEETKEGESAVGE